MNNTPGLASLLWFVVIIALIPLGLRMLKRTSIGSMGGTPGLMRSVAVLPLSPQQRLITVEVGRGEERRWLVLGVTAQSITTLHTMAPQEEPVVAHPGAPAFASWLERLRQDKGPTGGH
jgi:flagellar protein FliO/FliZ